MAQKARPRSATPPENSTRELSLLVRWAILAGLVILVAGGIWLWYSMSRDDLSWEISKAELKVSQGDFKGAHEHLNRAALLDPTVAKRQETLIELVIGRGFLDDAEAWIIQLPQGDPAIKTHLRLAVAVKAMELGQTSRVETILQSVLLNDPQQTMSRQLLSRLYLLTHRAVDLRRQLAFLDQPPVSHIDSDSLLLYCIGTRAGFNESTEPLEWLRQALRFDPNNAAVRAALAYRLMKATQREEARSLLAESKSNAPDHWRIVLVQIEDLIETGQWNDAAQLLDNLGQDANGESRLWVARGRVAAERQDCKTARLAYETASRIDPFEPEPVYRAARLAREQGEEQRARDLLKRAELLELLNRAAILAFNSPRDRRTALQETAALAEKSGFLRIARLLYQDLVANNPDLASARSQLVRLTEVAASQQPLSMQEKIVLPPVKGLSSRENPVSQAPQVSSPHDTQPSTELPAASVPQFRDVAAVVGLNYRYYNASTQQHWLMETLGAGVGVLDFDLDGWPDLYFPQGSPLPVPDTPQGESGQLFRNLRGERFEEITGPAKIADFGSGHGCAVADFDNDGFPDFLVCHYGTIRFYRNQGDGTFLDFTAASGLVDSQWSTSAAFGDFDRDGDLDLFIVHYVTAPWGQVKPCGSLESATVCRPTDYPPARNAIWENRGDGTFVERSAEAGILAVKGNGLGVIVEDLDNDGWPDIYVANDMTPKFLFHNRGRPAENVSSPFSFTETGVAAGVALNGQGESQASMGMACADVDADGHFDLFVTNFQEEMNTFYRNLGGLSFSDDTSRARLLDLTPPKMGWGCQFIDSMGRGQLDLFHVNGHLLITPQTPSYFRNDGKRFTELKIPSQYFQTERMGRAVALFDWNRDLRADLAVTYLKGNASLINNESPVGNRVAVELIGRTSNRDAEGARVTVFQGSRKSYYRVSRGGGYLASNDKVLPIGLGSSKSAERWEIVWPSGKRQECGPLRAGQYLRVLEGLPPQPVGRL